MGRAFVRSLKEASCRSSPSPEPIPRTHRCPRMPTPSSSPGRRTSPSCPAARRSRKSPGAAFSGARFLCVIFTIASVYSGLKVGQVMEAAIPISILAIGTRAHVSAPVDDSGERDHHRHRRRVGLGGGGSDFHAAGAVHPASRSAPAAVDAHLHGGRMPGRAVPDSAAALLRARNARKASRIRKPPRSPRCSSRAKRVARRRSSCCRPRSFPASTTSS